MEPSWDEYERLHVVRRLTTVVAERFGLRLGFVRKLANATDGPVISSAPIVLLGRRAGYVVATGEDRLTADDADWLQRFVRICAAEVAAFDEEALGGPAPVTGAGSGGDGGGPHDLDGYGGIIGRSRGMRRLFELLDKVRHSDATVLIQGDNGTGKELVAKAIHAGSSRQGGPFVVVNCSAFNDNLLDSELFGHRRGAFTGAVADKPGLFDVADRGTFFLDEIGDTSPVLQVKLLRVLQEGTFLPVGGTQMRKVDVRVLAATNRNLTDMVREGAFRQDLYYRLHVITLMLPALARRGGDVALLAEHFLATHTGGRRVGRKRLSEGAMEVLQAHDWPGNVRELENEIERLVVMSGDAKVITEELLSPRIRQPAVWRGGGGPSGSGAGVGGGVGGGIGGGIGGTADDAEGMPEAVQSLERAMIRDALLRSRWNKTQAAKALGISRRNLIRKVQSYGIEPRRRSG